MLAIDPLVALPARWLGLGSPAPVASGPSRCDKGNDGWATDLGGERVTYLGLALTASLVVAFLVWCGYQLRRVDRIIALRPAPEEEDSGR